MPKISEANHAATLSNLSTLAVRAKEMSAAYKSIRNTIQLTALKV